MVEIAGESVPQNSSAWINLEIAQDADLSSVFVSMYVINGKEEGPTLWLQGVLHGNEQVGGLAIRDFILDVSPEEVAGTIIAVPVANPRAFANKSRDMPMGRGQTDPNRLFPGSETGTFTQKYAARLYKPAEKHADYFLSIHSSGSETVMDPGFTVVYDTGDDEVLEEGIEMANVADIPHIAQIDQETAAGTMVIELVKNGVPSAVLEAGGAGQIYDWAYDAFFTGVENVTKHLGLLEGEPEQENDPTLYEGLAFLLCDKGGYFESFVEGDDLVDEGDPLGEITDIKGNTQEVIESPYDGVVLAIRTFPMARPGDMVFELAPQEGAEGYSMISP